MGVLGIPASSTHSLRLSHIPCIAQIIPASHQYSLRQTKKIIKSFNKIQHISYNQTTQVTSTNKI